MIEQHLAWAEEAGIDVLIVSWWGRRHSDVALGQLLDLRERDVGPSRLLLRRRAGERPEAFVSDILYLLDRYGDHPATFKHDGAPMV